MKITFFNFQKTLLNIGVSKVKKFAVAVSGGADSICLTFLLNEFCKANNVDLIAITVDHKLRKESTEEAKSISKYMKKLGIKHIVLTWEHPDIKSNIQGKARKARYKILCDYCIEKDIKHLFVGHNYDDQAETVMLRILRGSGINGIAGIEACSKMYGTMIIRPLLNFKKSEILAFVKAKGLVWIEDKSNADAKFDRVKVRQLLQQFDNRLPKRLNLLAENANRAKNFLNSYTDKIFKKHCLPGNLGHISIKYSDFFALDEEIKLRIINKIIKYIHNDPFIYPIRLNSLISLLKKLQYQSKFTLGKCKIIVHKGTIYFYKEPKFIEPAKKLLKGDNIWDKRYKININADGFYVTKLTKEIWSKIKPKEYVHQVPSEIIFSTPVILSASKDYYWTFLLGHFLPTTQDKLNIKIDIIKFHQLKIDKSFAMTEM